MTNEQIEDKGDPGKSNVSTTTSAEILIPVSSDNSLYTWPKMSTSTVTSTTNSTSVVTTALCGSGGQMPCGQTPSYIAVKPTQYGTYVSETGMEFIRTSTGEFALIQTNQPPRQVQPQVVNYSSSIGTLQEFKPDDEWDIYKERLEQYFKANYVCDER